MYGAAIEEETRYSVESDDYWDIVYSKALLRITKRIEIFSCEPVEDELSDAPEPLPRRSLSLCSRARPLESTQKVFQLTQDYARVGVCPPDALIASFASASKLDALVTVNRRHLKRSETIRKIANINRGFRLRPLRILLPGELLELLT